jgi:hypothetical protein
MNLTSTCLRLDSSDYGEKIEFNHKWSNITDYHHVKWVPYHSTADPQAVDGEGGQHADMKNNW